VPTNELTFVLTSGGHNAGIVSEPGHRGRTYQVRTRQPGEKYIDPDTWQAEMLATDYARLITGETVYVDGGYHILG
jgi:poly(3-hydroxyalkanoate) synthetase